MTSARSFSEAAIHSCRDEPVIAASEAYCCDSGRVPARPGSYEWQPPKKTEQMSFDEMMNKFKQTSDEKMSDLKRMENKRGGSSRRGNSRKQ